MIVQIVGTGHSGSTLMDMVLGAHPDVFSLGEIKHFPSYFQENRLCTCGQPVRKCPVWHEVGYLVNSEMKGMFVHDPHILDLNLTGEKKSYQNLFDLSVDIYKAQISESPFRILKKTKKEERKPLATSDIVHFYDIVKSTSACSILVDSSKSSIRARTIARYHPSYPMKFIHLVRDGRGYLHSKIKRIHNRLHNKPVLTRFAASKRWLIANLFAEGMARTIPANRLVRIKYEDFCDFPVEVLNQICDFIGIRYCDCMLNFRSVTHHNIGGNGMRFRDESIKKSDQEWRRSLTNEDLRVFNLVSGWLNYLYGYR